MPKSATFFEILNLSNLTTDTTLIKKIGDTRVEAIECSHDHFSFLCGQKTCGTDHLVKVEGLLRFSEAGTEFSCVGKVVTLHPVSEADVKATVQLTQFDKDVWKFFIRSLEEKQGKVDRLFKSMKDEA